jgi:dynein heavy chain 1
LTQYECSAFIIDTWIDSVSAGRSNIAPQNLPWDMLRTLITETYGGKIDNESDFAQLSSLVSSFLTPAAFDIGHKLIEDIPSTTTSPSSEDETVDALIVPSGTGMKDFMDWVNRLPEREPPTYLGLPANAEKLLLVGHGRSMIGSLGKITEMLEEGEHVMAEAA